MFNLLGEIVNIQGQELLDLFEPSLEVLGLILDLRRVLYLHDLQTFLELFEHLMKVVNRSAYTPQFL